MKKNGFTIIEVALVLAIAGLIFVMVFIALPGVWANERDSERRDHVLTFIQNLKNFQSNNNRGALPFETNVVVSGEEAVKARGASAQDKAKDATTWFGFYRDFFDDSFGDPDGGSGGTPYNLRVSECGASKLDASCESINKTLSDSRFPNDYTFYVVIGGKCYGEEVVSSANNRKVAVLYRLEAGGIYCANS